MGNSELEEKMKILIIALLILGVIVAAILEQLRRRNVLRKFNRAHRGNNER